MSNNGMTVLPKLVHLFHYNILQCCGKEKCSGWFVILILEYSGRNKDFFIFKGTYFAEPNPIRF